MKIEWDYATLQEVIEEENSFNEETYNVLGSDMVLANNNRDPNSTTHSAISSEMIPVQSSIQAVGSANIANTANIAKILEIFMTVSFHQVSGLEVTILGFL